MVGLRSCRLWLLCMFCCVWLLLCWLVLVVGRSGIVGCMLLFRFVFWLCLLVFLLFGRRCKLLVLFVFVLCGFFRVGRRCRLWFGLCCLLFGLCFRLCRRCRLLFRSLGLGFLFFVLVGRRCRLLCCRWCL